MAGPCRAVLASQLLERSPGHRGGKAVCLLLPPQAALCSYKAYGSETNSVLLSQEDLQSHCKQLFVNPCVFVNPNICKPLLTNWKYLSQ